MTAWGCDLEQQETLSGNQRRSRSGDGAVPSGSRQCELKSLAYFGVCVAAATNSHIRIFRETETVSSLVNRSLAKFTMTESLARNRDSLRSRTTPIHPRNRFSDVRILFQKFSRSRVSLRCLTVPKNESSRPSLLPSFCFNWFAGRISQRLKRRRQLPLSLILSAQNTTD